MRTIEDYRAGCLVYLGDSAGRRYTAGMIDAGLREALDTLRLYVPGRETVCREITEMNGNEAVLFSCDPDHGILSVRDGAGKLLRCSVSLWNHRLYLTFYGPEVPGAGEKLELELSVPWLIRGLDGASQTTVPESLCLTLMKGAAASAMKIRARSITEVFGKRPEDRAALMDQAMQLEREFRNELNIAARLRSGRMSPWGK